MRAQIHSEGHDVVKSGHVYDRKVIWVQEDEGRRDHIDNEGTSLV